MYKSIGIKYKNIKLINLVYINFNILIYKYRIMNCSSTNGRVDILSPNTNLLFAMTDRKSVNQGTDFRDAMTGNWYDTRLSLVFFSKENIQILQNGIRAGVFQKSNKQYLIDNQNEDELKIIMRSIFLQHSKNLATNIPEQIKQLNQIVLDYAVVQVYGETEGYMKYKRDASTLVVPLALPMLSTMKSSKQLELKKWF